MFTLLHLVKIHCLQLVLWYPCLTNQRKSHYGLLLLAIWKVFGTKNSALDFLSHPVHYCMGLIGIKSIIFSVIILFTNSFVVHILNGTTNGVIGYSNFQQIGRFLVPKTVFWTFLHPVHCCMGLFGIESITIIEKTLLATSFVVSVLKEKTKIVL